MGDKNTLLNNCACVRIRMDSHCSMMNNIHTTTESCNSKSYTALLTADAYWLYFAVLLLWIVSFTTVFIWFSLLVKEKKNFLQWRFSSCNCRFIRTNGYSIGFLPDSLFLWISACFWLPRSLYHFAFCLLAQLWLSFSFRILRLCFAFISLIPMVYSSFEYPKSLYTYSRILFDNLMRCVIEFYLVVSLRGKNPYLNYWGKKSNLQTSQNWTWQWNRARWGFSY